MKLYCIAKYILVLAFLTLALREASVINLYHPEMDSYIPNYFSDGSVSQIIFAPINELDLTNTHFRGRELGSALNFLDLHLMFKLVQHSGFFFSPISIVMGCMILMMLHGALNKLHPDRRFFIDISLTCLMFSAPFSFLGLQYRTNKVACVFFFVVGLFVLVHKKKFNKLWYLTSIIMATLLACLSDEQGIILALASISVGGVVILRGQGRSAYVNAIDLIGLLGGVLIYFTYKNFIGSYLFYLANGVNPVAPALINNINIDPNLLLASLKLFIRYISFVYPFMAVFLLGYGVFHVARAAALKQGDFLNINLLVCISYVLMIIFIAAIYLMGSVHRGIFFKDIVSYYNFPMAVAWYLIATLLLLQLSRISKRVHLLLIALLVCCLYMNVANTIRWEGLIANGHLKSFLKSDIVIKAVYSDEEVTEQLLESIRVDGASPGYSGASYAAPGVNALKKYLYTKGNRRE